MWSWRLCIHVSSSNSSILKTDLHILFHLRYAVNFYLQQILHKDSLFRWFLQLFLLLAVFTQQVMYFFIVYLYETASNKMGFTYLIFCNSYNLWESSGNDSFALLAFIGSHHGVCLTTTCLTICKDSSIIAVEDTINERKGTLLIDEVLGWVRGEDEVEGEALGWFLGLLFEEVNLVIGGVDLDGADTG